MNEAFGLYLFNLDFCKFTALLNMQIAIKHMSFKYLNKKKAKIILY